MEMGKEIPPKVRGDVWVHLHLCVDLLSWHMFGKSPKQGEESQETATEEFAGSPVPLVEICIPLLQGLSSNAQPVLKRKGHENQKQRIKMKVKVILVNFWCLISLSSKQMHQTLYFSLNLKDVVHDVCLNRCRSETYRWCISLVPVLEVLLDNAQILVKIFPKTVLKCNHGSCKKKHT